MDLDAQIVPWGESYSAAVSEFGRTQYRPRRPDETVLYKLVQENWETFQARVHDSGKALPKHPEIAPARAPPQGSFELH